MELRSGDQINHYTLLEPLGAGGQGSVWKVLDPRGGGVVRALKIVSRGDAQPAAFDRARREAKILTGVSHPALVTCHGLFEERDGVVGLLMDLVPGRSLAATIDDRRLDHAQSSAVLGHLADALACVHEAGLVHRDIKPENIILTDDFWQDPSRPGTVKLVDFGIAVSTDDAQLTRPGSVIGTISYLAPEIVDPATWGKVVGPPRDIFAFGVLGCRLLLGRHPTGLGFNADLIDYARAYKAAQVGRIAWPPSGIDGTWGTIVAACLALRPSDRLADGAALAEMLRTGVPSRKGGISEISGPTAAYTDTERSAPTEVVRLPPRIAVGPAQARTIPGAPLPEAMYATSPRSRGGPGLATLLVAILAATGGALGFWFFSRSSSEAPASAPRVEPTTTPPPPPAPDLRPTGPCRNPELPFDARDTPFACPPCPGRAPPLAPRPWLMRVHGVTMTPTPAPDPTLKDPLVCFLQGESITA
jgi:serine/threonine-protein kinase